jgi:hypothetical protein
MKFLSLTLPLKEAEALLEDFSELNLLQSLTLFDKLGGVNLEKFFDEITFFVKVLPDNLTFRFKKAECKCEKGEWWDDWDCNCDLETLETYVFDVSNTYEMFLESILYLKECSGKFNFTTLAIWDMSELEDVGIKSVPEDDDNDAPTILYREPEDLE